MFSILPEANFKFLVTFVLLSAKAFNLDQSKFLSFGKELYNTLWEKETLFVTRIFSLSYPKQTLLT